MTPFSDMPSAVVPLQVLLGVPSVLLAGHGSFLPPATDRIVMVHVHQNHEPKMRTSEPLLDAPPSLSKLAMVPSHMTEATLPS